MIGITDHSFTQPYILLSAHVQEDQGYFGERLAAAQVQLAKVWELRAVRLTPTFHQTDIVGALQLASELLDQDTSATQKRLVIFSDMRQSTAELDLEESRTVPSFATVIGKCGLAVSLSHVEVQILGADGAGKTDIYWRALREFWMAFFQCSGAVLQRYSELR